MSAWGRASTIGALVWFCAGTAQALDLNQALDDAATVGDAAIAGELLRRGADAQAVDAKGWTALAYASRYDQPEVATLLINSGARPWAPTPSQSPLAIAIVSRSTHVLPILLSKGVPPVVYNDALTLAAADSDPASLDAVVDASGLTTANQAAIARALAAGYHLNPGSPPKLDGHLVMAAIKVCRDKGVYSTDKCLSAPLVAATAAPGPTAIPVQDCDRLTSLPADPDALPGVPSVYSEQMNAAKATTACLDAVARYPGEVRFSASLGRAYARIDPAKAIQYLKKAATAGSRTALYELGMLSLAQGDEQNQKRAGEYLAKAADFKVYAAIAALGTMYVDQKGVARDYAKAKSLFETAAQHGDGAAMVGLGNLYEHGLGVARDPDTAFGWYKKAAAVGWRPGLVKTAQKYAAGEGTEKNLPESVRLYQTAAAEGDPQSQKVLQALDEPDSGPAPGGGNSSRGPGTGTSGASKSAQHRELRADVTQRPRFKPQPHKQCTSIGSFEVCR